MHSGFVRAGTAGREHSQSRALLGAAALVAIAGPVAWLAHGVASHGSALFFMSRVAAYRRALGASEPVLSSLVAYPLALLRTEPEVALVSVVALRMVADRAPGALRGLGRPALVLAGILAFLMVGRLLDGAPTHHAERTLLPIWTGLALLAAEALVRAARPSSDSSRGAELARGMPVLLAIAAASVALRITTPREPFAARRAERAIGYAARRLVPEGDRIAIDTADYGYFAVIATFGAPERADPIDRHDPRDPPAEDPFVSAERLRSCLASHRAGWLVARQPHLSIASAIGEAVATAGELSLVSVAPSTR